MSRKSSSGLHWVTPWFCLVRVRVRVRVRVGVRVGVRVRVALWRAVRPQRLTAHWHALLVPRRAHEHLVRGRVRGRGRGSEG